MTSADASISRRDLLAVATAAAIVLPKDAQAMTTAREGLPRVAVIGAGFSGLACAYELSAVGYAVDVFEARNRIGGRVRTAQQFAPDQHVEFGAELIGRNHPHWLRYAKKFHIELMEMEDDEVAPTYVLGGKRLSPEDARAVMAGVDAAYAELTRAAETVDANEPWKSANAEKLDAMSVADWLKTVKASDLVRQAAAVELIHDMAVPLEKMNYLALLCTIKGHGGEKFWEDTEVYRTKAGNQTLASHLAAGLHHGDLYLDCPVTKVHAEATGMAITLQDGRTLKYGDVVLSVPPSTWSRIEFSPELPRSLRPQMGKATKFLTVCSKEFWRANQSSNALTDTLVGSTWEGPAADKGEHRSLVGFAGGPFAERICQLPLATQADDIRSAFDTVMPGYRESHLKSEFVDWPGDPWTLGGYSFPLPGQFLSQGKLMRDGIGRLHFAGEHTSFGFIGYMEGGLETGASLAARIIQRDRAV
jgi:monoamine oxidase